MGPDTLHAIAQVALEAAHTGASELPVAVETVIGFGDEAVFDFAMLLVSTAEHRPGIEPPYVYVGMTVHTPGAPATGPNDDIVLTLLSFGFGRRERADLDGVRSALANARSRGVLPEVLARLAAVAGAAASLQQFSPQP